MPNTKQLNTRSTKRLLFLPSRSVREFKHLNLDQIQNSSTVLLMLKCNHDNESYLLFMPRCKWQSINMSECCKRMTGYRTHVGLWINVIHGIQFLFFLTDAIHPANVWWKTQRTSCSAKVPSATSQSNTGKNVLQKEKIRRCTDFSVANGF